MFSFIEITNLEENMLGWRGTILRIAVIPKIYGNAYVTAISHVIIEPEDPLKYGFSTRVV